MSTLYATLNKHDQTSTFAALVSRFPDLVTTLDDPSQTCTVWAPSNAALTSNSAEQSDDAVRELVLRHISPAAVSTTTLSHCVNIPVLSDTSKLNGHQLIRVRPRYTATYGPTHSINFESYIAQTDISANNGVMHIIDRCIEAVPDMSSLLDELPSQSFSLLVSAIRDTNFSLGEHRGGTFFAPTDAAFRKHGPIEKSEHLEALLRAHFCPDQTLYSNYFYAKDATPRPIEPGLKFNNPSGEKNFTLQTATPDQSLPLTIWRYGGHINMKFETGARVISADHLATNGVVHVVDDFVLDPKTL